MIRANLTSSERDPTQKAYRTPLIANIKYPQALGRYQISCKKRCGPITPPEIQAYFKKNLRETVFFVRIAYVVCGMSPVDYRCHLERGKQ